MQTTFADTVLNITVTGPLVRLELGTVTPAPGSNGKQEFTTTPTQQVVMPLEGFIRAFGMQETVIKKLVADGVIKAQPAAAPGAAAG
ncbi:hypothetical protein [Azohydromonas caseinilytica]|uniref:Uncharacterized protein n=1 Tax=Azohydromonas caseinilytica TaxID=2728836 RepID=A0A848F739_9BURK|nr:hypothetical protein [Azohydromonas caseinilytica]NML14070.1 hypothetical protein [Azohydromonas caseinilytica]